MSVPRLIEISKIHRRADARPLDDKAVEVLVESIAAVGLINPVRVRLRPDNDYELIAGCHRLAAIAAGGEHEIFCVEVTDDDLHAELAMIDENFVRAELSAADSAAQMKRRKEIYEELHPETRNGENQHSRVRQNGEGSAAPRFTADTASKTGQSERTVQRLAERGNRIVFEALCLVRGTVLDSASYLDTLKDVHPDEQVATVKRDLAQAKKQKAERSACSSKARKKAAASAARSVKVSEPAAGLSFADLLALLDKLAAVPASDVIAACPARERASLCSRLSHLINVFSTVIEEIAP